MIISSQYGINKQCYCVFQTERRNAFNFVKYKGHHPDLFKECELRKFTGTLTSVSYLAKILTFHSFSTTSNVNMICYPVSILNDILIKAFKFNYLGSLDHEHF